ncbi:MAG: hypothetical protein JRJ42_10450 [Deltaproteobacteria bacterium]|nr:hypothetical protein [Deltaproteobacteria bacterium]MBW2021033.1 hypothetical protein [Deltaproteobacteria bacterium]MBW2075699.1 hypothetical protein [Deltaproteobacteria bacterium]RLB81774.1 MAG: hypothetical protein DRH17_08105 [Deltaproteobacteria bacterium]
MALEIYKKEKGLIDLVILDLDMPGIGDYRCMEELLKMDPEIKIVAKFGPKKACLSSMGAS